MDNRESPPDLGPPLKADAKCSVLSLSFETPGQSTAVLASLSDESLMGPGPLTAPQKPPGDLLRFCGVKELESAEVTQICRVTLRAAKSRPFGRFC
ncbi:hypothetical protein Q5P01_012737 [Channa striata]|uniref:Uncharacterized protein n=1 Tax=Channa striata TaxID=64152 RepID=A0AA88MP85_CHASR|nr:hypothetical protein Q5P01_012737 [Channa striata]